MGLRDRLIAKAMTNLPDHRSALIEALGPNEKLLGFTFSTPVAFETGSGTGFGTARLTGLVINKVTEQVSKARHISGDSGSIARTLPRDAASRVLAISSWGLSIWDFGPTSQTFPPSRLVAVARQDVRSITRTGQSRGGYVEIRVVFSDESFFDYRAAEHALYADFWSAVESFA
ncbi:hypothetical protein ABIA35_000033 [Catenulispora sp. MAP12-49]|uniref:hypothetical protein n=1 Tax=unclassified Catenulispora TaxID=414885 RepID=UPI003512BAF5